MKTASWVILTLVGVLVALGSLTSAWLAIVLGPYRRREVWAWWAILGGVLALAIITALRVPTLGVARGVGAALIGLGVVIVGLLLDVARLRASRSLPLDEGGGSMTRTIVRSAFAAVLLALTAGRLAEAQDLQQKLAAAKASAAQNQQALRAYTWIEKVELSLKGEVKNTTINSCRYGPDGKVQKTPIVQPPPPEKKRGLRGKVIEKKTGEMKAELEDAVALVHQYVPPDSGKMQVVMNAGAASLAQAGPGVVVLKFATYEKAGDSLGLTFDSTVKALRQMDVATYLESPQSPVTLRVGLQALPEGTNYPGSVVLAMPARQIEVRITNSNYQKLAQ